MKLMKKMKTENVSSDNNILPLNKVFRVVFAIFCVFALSFATMSITGVGIWDANAVEFDGGSGYADELIGDNGWKSDVITDLEPGVDSGDMGQGLVDDLSTFFLHLGVIIIAITFILCVFRLAGRAVWMMVAGGNGSIQMNNTKELGQISYSDMWIFFMTAEERKTKIMKDEWFTQMMKETLFFLMIGCGAGGLVILLTLIASVIIGNFAGISHNAGVGDFNVSGIHVTTDGNNWKGTNN